jgi:hypothetical protein
MRAAQPSQAVELSQPLADRVRDFNLLISFGRAP